MKSPAPALSVRNLHLVPAPGSDHAWEPDTIDVRTRWRKAQVEQRRKWRKPRWSK